MRILIFFLLILTFTCSSTVLGANEEDLGLDDEAVNTLKGAIEFLEGIERFEIKARVIYDVVQEDGRRLQFEKQTRLIQQRPNKLFVERLRDDGNVRKFWYDGSHVSILSEEKNAYAQLKAPGTIDETLDMFEGLFNEPHPLADLLYSDLGHLLELPEEAYYVGSSNVGSFQCSHLVFRNTNLDWQIWVQKGELPFIRKVVITYRNKPGIPQFVGYLDSWLTPASINPNVFAFTPPKEAERLAILLPPAVTADRGGQP